jgi:hypothetical protein
MRDFLLNTQTGDCTEFSNAAAILMRLAGVPTRVVTGYLAADSLQTPAHRRGLQVLQRSITPLQQYPGDELYLVTTAHRHSWLQLYMPGYGWVDFDPTNYAIPPQGSGNPNTRDVVIPLIKPQDLRTASDIPWMLIIRGLTLLFLIGVVVSYIVRYTRQLYLGALAKRNDRRGLRALYTLLLMRLSSAGYELKTPARTAWEYAREYPELRRFAGLYTELRHRESFREGEWDELWRLLREEYRSLAARCKQGGLVGLLRRAFSLRMLYYR